LASNSKSKMQGSKILAFFITFLVAFSAIHFAILKPEGINIFDSKIFSSITLPTFGSDRDEKKASISSKKTTIKKSYNKKSSINGFSPFVVDNFNGVDVFSNGKETNVFGRNTTADGYNLGLRYQCVEFVKRYYYEHYGHKMPNSYGHAKEFFDFNLSDGSYNKDRALSQYRNPSYTKPQEGDLIVFGPTPSNGYGHVAIICKVSNDHIQFVQQNGGPKNPTRINVPLDNRNGKYQVLGKHIVGWLRK